MSTITKEWLQQTITEFENTRDDIPFGLDDDDAKILKVLKQALASLTAEPVMYVMAAEHFDTEAVSTCKSVVDGWVDEWNQGDISPSEPQYRTVPLYTAPPAPVSEPAVSDNSIHDLFLRAKAMMYQSGGSPIEHSLNPVDTWLFEAERAAMLQAEPVSPVYKLHDDWVSCSGRLPDTDTYVLVSNGFWVGMGKYSDDECLDTGENWQDEHGEFIDLIHHPVTHWMTLPAAPQQEAKA